VSGINPRGKLRTYLILYFVPLTVAPLIVLTVLTLATVRSAVNREVERRSQPELASLNRNLDLVDRKLERELEQLARNDDFRVALLAQRRIEAQTLARAWLGGSHFDRARLYGVDGQLIESFEDRSQKSIEKKWRSLLATRDALKGDARQPQSISKAKSPVSASEFREATSRLGARNSLSLAKRFRAFLKNEDSWLAHDVITDVADPQSDGLLESVFYKAVVDSDFKTIGFIEASYRLDSTRLKALAAYQGVDLILLSPQMDWLASSDESFRWAFLTKIPNLKALAEGSNLDGYSTEFSIRDEPVQFFLTPWQNEGGQIAAYFGLGLFKGDQVELERRIIFWIAGVAALLLILVVYTTIRVSNLITRPVSKLVDAVEDVRQGKWVQPVELDEKTEMGFLVARFNEMASSIQITKRMLENKLDELAKAQGQLVQSAKLSSLGQLVAGVAHELNNPIAFIYSNMTQMKLHLRMLERVNAMLKNYGARLSKDDLSQFQKELDEIEWDYVRSDMNEMVQSCLEGSIRVKDIVLGLRNFSRLDKGEVVEADLNKALEDTVKLLAGQLKNRIEVHWDLAPEARVRCNPNQMNQVFMNLIANAAQAIEGRGDLWIRSYYDDQSRDRHLVIEVRDTGKGIAQAHLDKIFDPFFTTKRVGEGTGLGLAIVYGIVEKHHGQIIVKSVTEGPGRGTTFTVKIPISTALEQAS
jgi:two-component system NtrC family sensor kinase